MPNLLLFDIPLAIPSPESPRRCSDRDRLHATVMLQRGSPTPWNATRGGFCLGVGGGLGVSNGGCLSKNSVYIWLWGEKRARIKPECWKAQGQSISPPQSPPKQGLKRCLSALCFHFHSWCKSDICACMDVLWKKLMLRIFESLLYDSLFKHRSSEIKNDVSSNSRLSHCCVAGFRILPFW